MLSSCSLSPLLLRSLTCLAECLFSNLLIRLNTIPVTRPATVPLTKTVVIVPGTLTAKNAAASPDAVVSCSDYARNMITHSIKYYTEKAGHLVSEIQITKDFTFVKLFVRNNTSSPISKDVILGFYDSEGKLLTALKQPVSLLSGGEKSLSFSSLKDITEAADLSVFIWDNALQPFTKATSYILK